MREKNFKRDVKCLFASVKNFFPQVEKTVITIMEKGDVEPEPFIDALKAEAAVEKNGLTCIPRDLVWMAMRSGYSLF